MERGRLVWRFGLGRLLFGGGKSAKDHESLFEEEEVILLTSAEDCLDCRLSLLSMAETETEVM